ncbi:MAG: class B sortase [Lachnospiraceae bacterium]|nr:class B sortase [Lachnospiraceae bacterium]
MKLKKTDWKYKIILILAAAALLFAAARLGQFLWEYYGGRQEYGRLEELAVQGEAAEGQGFFVDFDELQKINPDVIGWIRLEDLGISYPIVQGKDNEYYLHHTFYNKENKCGCIFMEVENAPDFSDQNSFLYGHNMKDRSMFAKLNEFREEETYRKNPEFFIYTPEGTGRYEIFSCYATELKGDAFLCQFANEETYGEWQQRTVERSLYDTGVKVSPKQKTVTLMTCTPAGGRERFLVHGVLADFYED